MEVEVVAVGQKTLRQVGCLLFLPLALAVFLELPRCG